MHAAVLRTEQHSTQLRGWSNRSLGYREGNIRNLSGPSFEHFAHELQRRTLHARQRTTLRARPVLIRMCRMIRVMARKWMKILILYKQCRRTFVFLGTSSPRSWQTPRAMRYYTPSVTAGTGSGQSAWSGQSRSTVTLPRMTWLQQDYEHVLRQSKELHERKYDQQHIDALYKRLERVNQAVRAHRLHACIYGVRKSHWTGDSYLFCVILLVDDSDFISNWN